MSIEVDLIMKFNKTAAFALCLMMLAVTGCSGKSDSESGSGSSKDSITSAAASTQPVTASASSAAAETSSSAETTSAANNMKKDSGAVDVVWNPAVEDLKKTVKEREKGYKSASGIDPSSVKSDIVKCNGIDAGWICYTRTQGEKSTVWSMYMFPDSEGTIVFNFSADADKYEKCVPEFEKLLNTVTVG